MKTRLLAGFFVAQRREMRKSVFTEVRAPDMRKKCLLAIAFFAMAHKHEVRSRRRRSTAQKRKGVRFRRRRFRGAAEENPSLRQHESALLGGAFFVLKQRREMRKSVFTEVRAPDMRKKCLLAIAFFAMAHKHEVRSRRRRSAAHESAEARFRRRRFRDAQSIQNTLLHQRSKRARSVPRSSLRYSRAVIPIYFLYSVQKCSGQE